MGLGFAVFAGTTPEIIRASAREAERLGVNSFWVNHPGSTDGLAALAHAARETRRLELGIGVIPLHTRGPESIVQGVTANTLPLDRLRLGVGSPNPEALGQVAGGRGRGRHPRDHPEGHGRRARGARPGGCARVTPFVGRLTRIPASIERRSARQSFRNTTAVMPTPEP